MPTALRLIAKGKVKKESSCLHAHCIFVVEILCFSDFGDLCNDLFYRSAFVHVAAPLVDHICY